MAPLTTTRTLLGLRVGSAHTIEVLLQIRLQDIEWWNSSLNDHECQLYKLFGRRVLPCDDVCRTAIEADRTRMRAAKEGKVVYKKMAAEATEKDTNNNGRKRRGVGKKKGADESAKQKRKKNNAKDGKNDVEDSKLKLLRATTGTWIMGKSIQICYIMEDIDQTTEDTLFFRQNKSISANDSDEQAINDDSVPSSVKKQSPSTNNEGGEGNDDDDEKIVPLASFRTWKKLPKRLNVWVFQFDPNNPTDLSLSEGGGFPRPDLLPMADIFRSFGD